MLRQGFGPRIFRALTLIYMSCIASSRPPFTILTASHQRPRSACPTISNRQLNHCAVSKMGRRIDPTTRDTVSTEYCEKDTSSSCSSGPDGTIEVFYEDPSDEQLERARHAAKRARATVMRQRKDGGPPSKATCRQDADHGVLTLDDARLPVGSHYTGTAPQNTYSGQVSTTQSRKSEIAQRNAYWDSTLPEGRNEKSSKATTKWVYSTDNNPPTFHHRTAVPAHQTTYLTHCDSDACSGKRDATRQAKASRSNPRKQRKRSTKVRGDGWSKCQCDECWVARDRGSRRINSKGHRVVDPGASSGCTVL